MVLALLLKSSRRLHSNPWAHFCGHREPIFLTAAWGRCLLTGDSRVPLGPLAICSEGQHSEKTQWCQEAAWPVSTESHGDSSQWHLPQDVEDPLGPSSVLPALVPQDSGPVSWLYSDSVSPRLPFVFSLPADVNSVATLSSQCLGHPTCD